MDDQHSLFFDLVNSDEIPTAHEIEKAGFPAEEAASLETFQSRWSVAPRLFLGAFIPQRTLIGYVNATLASSHSLTAESMRTHDPSGTSVCIHGVVVKEQYRRQGAGHKLMMDYISRLESNPKIGDVTGINFILVGKSPVVHGMQPWFEMKKEIASPAREYTAGHPDLMTALMNSSRNRPSSRLASSFSSQELVTSSETNTFDILCPRPGCGSLILKAGVAKLCKRESFELDPSEHPPPPPLQTLPSPPTQINWWLVTPSAMAFENIAFSRPVPSASSSSHEVARTKLLACAECELGPLGWCETGGSEFWIAVSRVGYR